MSFNPSKPVRTRNGLPARILATDIKGPMGTSIVFAITEPSGEIIATATSDGSYISAKNPHRWDLLNSDRTDTERLEGVFKYKISFNKISFNGSARGHYSAYSPVLHNEDTCSVGPFPTLREALDALLDHYECP